MSQAVVCDHCDQPARMIASPAGPAVPAGWIAVWRSGGDTLRHFCGWRCCANYAAMAHSVNEEGTT